MALQRISYENKAALIAQPGIADINKISDIDMNEIKTVVNAICDSTDENVDSIDTLNDRVTSLEEGIKIKSIIDIVYPVGAIYISYDSTNPGTLWPGTTWQREAEGRCIIGLGTGYPTVGAVGGGSTIDLSHTHTSASHNHSTGNHTLTVSEIPSHTHSIKSGYGDVDGTTYDSYRYQYWGHNNNGWKSGDLGTGSTGGGGAHNHGNTGNTTPGNTGSSLSSTTSIMQPYIVMYIWRRTE